MSQRIRKYCLTSIVWALIVSCSTQNTKWANVQYHNVSTHYNVWWNGNESLKSGVETLESSSKDDYTQLLNVYKLGSKQDAQAIFPQMDRAIEKGIKGVKKHSIFVGGEEHVDYIKECYLLTAYASFYKKDYVAANNSCGLITNQYAGTRAADEAAVLGARCLTMDGQYAEAETMLDDLVQAASKGNFSKSELEKLYLAMAECLIPQEKYKKAVQYLKLSLDQTKNHNRKARLNFILGQIYQKLDKRAAATKYYDEVISCHPDYVMEFNARINIASCANLENSNLAKLEKSLDNMLLDKKNEEFKDQIYYAKGEMYMGVKDAKKACDNFKLSVASSQPKSPQKAKSALRLAGILYELYENYDLAQIYYDTAMQSITPTYPNYFDIKSRYDMLTSLVSYTRVYDRNDSLIVVADMDSADRADLIARKIEKLKNDEEQARRQALIDQYRNDAKAQANTLVGDWYFYNANTVQKGKDKFKQTWGMLMLEDNWAISNKMSMSMGMVSGLETESDTSLTSDMTQDGAGEEKEKKDEAKDDPNDPHCVAFYLKDLPKSEQDRDSMRLQTAECLLNAGYIYNDGLGNTVRALECYLRMANEYTDYDGIVRALYQLYRIYDKQGNTPQSNYYRDMVLMGFPDSDFANMIRDSEYYKVLVRREQRIQEDYEDLYAMYRRRKYSEVISLANAAKENYPDDMMLRKFEYWKGLAQARMDNKNEALATFMTIVNEYPATDTIVPLAQEQIAFLTDAGTVSEGSMVTTADELRATGREGQQIAPASAKEEETVLSAEARLYRYKENIHHYVILIVNDKKVRCTELQSKVSNFNMQYYSTAGLKVNLFGFTDTTQLVTVHRFNNAASAVDYWEHIQSQDGPLAGYNSEYYKVIPISTQNYQTFYNKKNLDVYMEFLRKYYLKK